jgi:hypothetical protein
LTSGTGSTGGLTYPADLGTLAGRPIFNGGVVGNTSSQILTRFLADPIKFSWPVIIWAGRNNFTDPTTVKSDIAAMVANLGHTRYLILGIITQNQASEWSGQANYNTLLTLNSDLASIYGSHFIDIRPYLVSLYDPNQAQDVIDHGHDALPSSLQGGDHIHLVNAGYQAVANKVYQSISVLQ